MPKIGTMRIEYSEEITICEVHYNRSLYFHVKGLTNEFLTLGEFRDSGYRSEDELKSELQKAVHRYRLRKQSEKNVIMYSINATSALCSQITHNGSSTHFYNPPWTKPIFIEQSYEYGFGFRFEVVKKVDDGVAPKVYKYKDLNLDDVTAPNNLEKYPFNPDPKLKWKTIDYTPDRLAFFLNMSAALRDMAKKAAGFFGQDENALLGQIDNGMLLLNQVGGSDG